MSGPQLILWFERAAIERGEDKLLDLQVLVVPHTERPDESFRALQQGLRKMSESKKHG